MTRIPNAMQYSTDQRADVKLGTGNYADGFSEKKQAETYTQGYQIPNEMSRLFSWASRTAIETLEHVAFLRIQVTCSIRF